MIDQPPPTPDDDPAENVRRCYVHKCGSLFNVTSDYAISDDYEPISERAYRLLSAHARSEAPLIASVRELLGVIGGLEHCAYVYPLGKNWALEGQRCTALRDGWNHEPNQCAFEHEFVAPSLTQSITDAIEVVRKERLDATAKIAHKDDCIGHLSNVCDGWKDLISDLQRQLAAANAENELLLETAAYSLDYEKVLEDRIAEFDRLRGEQAITAKVIQSQQATIRRLTPCGPVGPKVREKIAEILREWRMAVASSPIDLTRADRIIAILVDEQEGRS